jgi:hypothetical protein
MICRPILLAPVAKSMDDSEGDAAFMSSTQTFYDRLVVGEQLGHLEYLVTEDVLARFREAVEYPEARFPHIAAMEHLHVLRDKYGDLAVISAGHQDQYFHPPIPNKRVQVSGWVRDKYRRQGRDWLVVETFAVDEDGRELVRSRHTLLVGGRDRNR